MSVIISSNIFLSNISSFPHPFSLLPFKDSIYSHIRVLKVVLQVTDALFIFIFVSCFPLILFKIVFIDMCSSSVIFSSAMSSLLSIPSCVFLSQTL